MAVRRHGNRDRAAFRYWRAGACSRSRLNSGDLLSVLFCRERAKEVRRACPEDWVSRWAFGVWFASKIKMTRDNHEHVRQDGDQMPPGHHGHDRHTGHSEAMFRDRFWLSFTLTIPTV